ncbi:MAG: ECF transporter S component [Acholeplasmataceae bacterium]
MKGIYMNVVHLKRMVYIVALASISIVLALFEIPWFIPSGPFSVFLRLDFSDVAILVAIVTLGPKDTIIVIILRSLVRVTFKGFIPENIIGEMIAVIAAISVMIGFILASKITRRQSKPFIVEVPSETIPLRIFDYLIFLGTVTLSLTIMMVLLNFFITTPLLLSYYGFTNTIQFEVFGFINDLSDVIDVTYNTVMTFLWAVVASYTPFNIVKGLSVSLIFLIIWPRLKYIEY